MNYKFSNVIKNIFVASIITIFLAILILSFNDIKGTFEVVKTANYKFLLIALALIILYMFFNILGLVVLLKENHCKLKLKDMYLIGATEPFFNGITPFATGGQPFQAYALCRKGVSVKDATITLMMNFIVFMISTNFFAILSLVFWNRYVSQIPNFIWIVIVGFVMNFIVLLLFLVVAFSKTVRNFIIHITKWLSNKKLFKKLLSGKDQQIYEFCNNVQTGCAELLKNPKAFLLCLVTKIISLIFYYSIPFVILLSLNVKLSINDFVYTLLATSFAVTLVVWLPTPGSTGGIELAFKSIFITISGVSGVIAMGGMVLWRLYTYYLLMLVGFICYLIFDIQDRKDRKFIQDNSKEANVSNLEISERDKTNDEKIKDIENNESVNNSNFNNLDNSN
jgi:glycosyltransferase 2 family protein